MTLSQPTQRTPAVAAPSLGKRDWTTMGPAAPSQQHAKRQAPMQQRPQGAPPTGGVSLPAAPTVGVRSPVPPGLAQGTPTPSGAPQPPQQRKTGVRNDPTKGWMARVIDPRRRVARDIGPFADGLQAALAHDRVAIACGGQRLLLPTAFYHAETAFLQRWEGDICDALEKGTYEKSYAKFLVAGFKAALSLMVGDDDGEQITDEGDALIAKCVGDGEVLWGDIEEFFLDRAEEIGEEALKLKDDGKLLRIRFVEMHRNKALCPEWRHNHRIQMQQQQQQMQIKQQQQQQQQINQQQQQQIQMKQDQQQEQILLRQQQFQQQQMMIQKQRQQQMMMARQQQQQQQHLDEVATLQAKQDSSS
jgi:hypothetical protein